MCTAFVRKGKDIITGFNFDMNVGGIEYVPVIEQNRAGLGMRFPADVVAAMPPSIKMKNNVRLIQGASSGGYVGGQLCNMGIAKAPLSYEDGMLTIDQLTDSFVTDHILKDQLMNILETRNVVNIPNNPEDDPSLRPLALHSLLVDPDGNILFVEPGNGYAVIKEQYFTVTNFPILELPPDLREDRFGYYGVDRYMKSLQILQNSADDFSVSDGLELLKEVKQTGTWATRFSFVYSRNENAVYYCLEGDFSHVVRHSF